MSYMPDSKHASYICAKVRPKSQGVMVFSPEFIRRLAAGAFFPVRDQTQTI